MSVALLVWLRDVLCREDWGDTDWESAHDVLWEKTSDGMAQILDLAMARLLDQAIAKKRGKFQKHALGTAERRVVEEIRRAKHASARSVVGALKGDRRHHLKVLARLERKGIIVSRNGFLEAPERDGVLYTPSAESDAAAAVAHAERVKATHAEMATGSPAPEPVPVAAPSPVSSSVGHEKGSAAPAKRRGRPPKKRPENGPPAKTTKSVAKPEPVDELSGAEAKVVHRDPKPPKLATGVPITDPVSVEPLHRQLETLRSQLVGNTDLEDRREIKSLIREIERELAEAGGT